jgi:hypothetical protein
VGGFSGRRNRTECDLSLCVPGAVSPAHPLSANGPRGFSRVKGATGAAPRFPPLTRLKPRGGLSARDQWRDDAQGADRERDAEQAGPVKTVSVLVVPWGGGGNWCVSLFLVCQNCVCPGYSLGWWGKLVCPCFFPAQSLESWCVSLIFTSWQRTRQHSRSEIGVCPRFLTINGTHTSVSAKHLNNYVKEFEYRFNRCNRPETMLPELLSTLQPLSG